MNSINIVGRLTKDIDIRYTPNSKAVGSFTVASDIGYGDNKKTNFFDCQLWGDRAEKVAQYLTKGQALTVIGELEIYKYQAKDGTERQGVRVNVNNFELQGKKQESQQAPASEPIDDIPF
ncbi:single-stranded DNA-binding protein [Neisseria sp. Ec49-e6-T10]|uniref:single-stranded DNA-binding protein n=1 Tax=Neisseria sp. Ec49-e6-T10 TaxID=3140744 RepID=UPI003EC041C8